MAKNGDGEFAFFICQIRHFAIGPPPPQIAEKVVETVVNEVTTFKVLGKIFGKMFKKITVKEAKMLAQRWPSYFKVICANELLYRDG